MIVGMVPPVFVGSVPSHRNTRGEDIFPAFVKKVFGIGPRSPPSRRRRRPDRAAAMVMTTVTARSPPVMHAAIAIIALDYTFARRVHFSAAGKANAVARMTVNRLAARVHLRLLRSHFTNPLTSR